MVVAGTHFVSEPDATFIEPVDGCVHHRYLGECNLLLHLGICVHYWYLGECDLLLHLDMCVHYCQHRLVSHNRPTIYVNMMDKVT